MKEELLQLLKEAKLNMSWLLFLIGLLFSIFVAWTIVYPIEFDKALDAFRSWTKNGNILVAGIGYLTLRISLPLIFSVLIFKFKQSRIDWIKARAALCLPNGFSSGTLFGTVIIFTVILLAEHRNFLILIFPFAVAFFLFIIPPWLDKSVFRTERSIRNEKSTSLLLLMLCLLVLPVIYLIFEFINKFTLFAFSIGFLIYGMSAIFMHFARIDLNRRYPIKNG